MLRDTDALIQHAQKIIQGYGPATVLDAVLHDAQHYTATMATTVSCDSEGEDDVFGPDNSPSIDLPPQPIAAMANIPSMGLW